MIRDRTPEKVLIFRFKSAGAGLNCTTFFYLVFRRSIDFRRHTLMLLEVILLPFW